MPDTWIAAIGTPDAGPGWVDTGMISDYREVDAPTPDTRRVTMRHVPDPVTVRYTDRSWFLAACQTCTPHLTMPFSTRTERQEWVNQHAAGAGHRDIIAWQEARA